MTYRHLVRPALFAMSRRDPERAHNLALRELAFVSRHPWLLRTLESMTHANRLSGGQEFFGLRFPSPIGLAAGFVKDARALPAVAGLGFGFIEAGGITQHGQPGHPRPRIWRYPNEEAVIQAMGFPNGGADATARSMQSAARLRIPLGWNVAKSMITDIDAAGNDYCASLRALHPYGDFFVINVSSPNTPGMRQLEGRERLDQLLQVTQTEMRALATSAELPKPKPLLIKISPDLSPAEIDDVFHVSLDRHVDGIIATNTTVRRELLAGRSVPDRGGLSGPPLAAQSLTVVTHLSRALDGRIPIIGVGGINSPDSVQRMLDSGASLVQLYTGLIFQGPLLIKRLNKAVVRRWTAAEPKVSSAAHSDDLDVIREATAVGSGT